MTPEAVVAQTFNRAVHEIDDTTSTETLGEWDSLGHITLIIELEAAFGVSFAPEETLTLTDVASIKRALEERSIAWS